MSQTANQKTFIMQFLSEKQEANKSNLIQAGINPLLAHSLVLRGIEKLTDVSLNKKIIPFSKMKGIKEAVLLVHKHIQNKNKICIIADYDADGATSCAIACLGLKMFGADVSYIVPNRFVHGYGLTPSVVEEAIAQHNPKLIITVDNGISSIEGVDLANLNGVEVLVTDHHLQGDTLPNASAIINPNQNECTFPSKALAGCGVIFYLILAINSFYKQQKLTIQGDVTSLIDLVAIGTISDLVPLDENNRLLVSLGLLNIHSGLSRPGVFSLINVCKKSPSTLTTSDIAFGVGPRINAAGRLKDMTIGINCLMSNNEHEALRLAMTLNEINEERKKIEVEIKEDAIESINLSTYPNICIAYGADYHEGVVGIVASRLKEMHNKPSIVFTNVMNSNAEIKGSGRSIPGIHLRDVLDYIHKKDPSIIIKFGGHAMAAGLTIQRNKLSEFTHLFSEGVSHFSLGKDLSNKVYVDKQLLGEDLTLENAYALLEHVWGQGFETPIFMSEATIVEQKLIGNDKHLRLKLKIDECEVTAVYFFQEQLIKSTCVTAYYNLSVNDFNGNVTLQLLIKELIPHQFELSDN